MRTDSLKFMHDFILLDENGFDFARNQYLLDSHSKPLAEKVMHWLHLMQEFWSSLLHRVSARISQKSSSANLPDSWPTKQPSLRRRIAPTMFLHYYHVSTTTTERERWLWLISKGFHSWAWNLVSGDQFFLSNSKPPLQVHWCTEYIGTITI